MGLRRVPRRRYATQLAVRSAAAPLAAACIWRAEGAPLLRIASPYKPYPKQRVYSLECNIVLPLHARALPKH